MTRLALVSGDGLDVSGLLTIARNVLQLGWAHGWIEREVPTELGYAWRPDKVHDFPTGSVESLPAPWMVRSEAAFLDQVDSGELATRLTEIRRGVAVFERLGGAARAALEEEIGRVVPLYRAHFLRWLERFDPDWVIALNMTLSDAVPASVGLHDAAREHYEPGENRGVVFWDHDLFGTCGIWDDEAGHRYYPERPNELTPVPQNDRRTRWVVVSESLRRECLSYPTALEPEVVANMLPPEITPANPEMVRRFTETHALDLRRPIILNPVRVFRIKGVDLSLRFFAEVLSVSDLLGAPRPYLLVFGSLREDPPYATKVQALARHLGIAEDVRFLNGVPVSTVADSAGRARLDEVALFAMAGQTRGGVVFTPTVSDVETVGLGPALAASAGLPAAISHYRAFETVYGDRLSTISVPAAPGAPLDNAAAAFRRQMLGWPSDRRREANAAAATELFPCAPWTSFLASLVGDRRGVEARS